MTTPLTTKGVMHGKTIELDQELGIQDGQEVTVTVQLNAKSALEPGEGLKRSAGGWEDIPELDEYLEQVRQLRKQGRPEIE
jgi:hypothetical protein